MLVNALLNESITEENYEKVLKKRLMVSYSVCILGIVTLVAMCIYSSTESCSLSDFLQGLYTGVGAGMIGAGVMKVIKIKLLLKNETKMKKKRLEEQDERNIMINQKAINAAALTVSFLLYIGLLIMGVFNLAVFWTLWIIMIGYVVVYICFYQFFQKKY